MMTNREKTAEYKQMRFPMGLFRIRNTVNGKTFTDSGLNMPARWNRHRFQLNLGNHPDQNLQQDWKDFGESAFIYEVVAELDYDPARPERDYRADVEALRDLWFEENGADKSGGYR